jgi:hypothetical protein
MTSAESSSLAPADALKQILDAARLDDAIFAVTELGIPELLPGEARPVEELAAESHTHGDLLARLLRFLVAGGVFTEPHPGHFGLTEMGACLRSDAPRSFRALVLFRGQQWKRNGWFVLNEVLRTRKVAFELMNGMPLFEFYEAHPEAGEIFNAAMTGLTRAMGGVVTSHYDFSGAKTIIDVGGGEGALLMEVLSANDGTSGVLFDLPPVARAAEESLARAGLSDRCRVIGGNFFETVPDGGDIYMMKMILHDWPDDAAETILRNCHASLGPQSRLLLIERVLPSEPPYDVEAFMLDIVMLLELGALERTETQWQTLLTRSGFRLSRIIPTPVPLQIIEALPV